MANPFFSHQASSSTGVSSPFCGDYEVVCRHGEPSPPKTVKSGDNKGLRFCGCPLWRTKNCKFFIWDHELDYLIKVHMKRERDGLLRDIDELMKMVDKMRDEKEALLEKISKLRMKKDLMETEAKRALKGEKNAFYALWISWFFIVVVIVVFMERNY